MNLNEGVVHSDNVDTAVVDAEKGSGFNAPPNAGLKKVTYALRKTCDEGQHRNQESWEFWGHGETYNAANTTETVDTDLLREDEQLCHVGL